MPKVVELLSAVRLLPAGPQANVEPYFFHKLLDSRSLHVPEIFERFVSIIRRE